MCWNVIKIMFPFLFWLDLVDLLGISILPLIGWNGTKWGGKHIKGRKVRSVRPNTQCWHLRGYNTWLILGSGSRSPLFFFIPYTWNWNLAWLVSINYNKIVQIFVDYWNGSLNIFYSCATIHTPGICHNRVHFFL